MSRRPSSYPHPVLGVNDDVSGELLCAAPSVDVGPELTQIALTEIQCTNESISAAIASRDAAFALHYRCGATFLRGSHHGHSEEILIQFPNGRLSGRVELSLHVCLLREQDWKPRGLHPDYEETVFRLMKGAIVALGQEFSFEVPDEFDPLTGSIASIFSVRQTSEQSAPATLRFDADNKIQIMLSKSEHAQFNRSKAQVPGLLHSGLAYPALVQAISRVNRPTDGDEEKTWFHRLSAILEQRRCDASDPFTAASTILGRPFERAATEVLKIIQSEDE